MQFDECTPYISVEPKTKGQLTTEREASTPWANTRPAPMQLWPTSELPMSSSLGRPTAGPWAFNVEAARAQAR